eukprot:SAG31_NODE_5590_length_2438_cov_1.289867_3_plen_158_part_00
MLGLNVSLGSESLQSLTIDFGQSDNGSDMYSLDFIITDDDARVWEDAVVGDDIDSIAKHLLEKQLLFGSITDGDFSHADRQPMHSRSCASHLSLLQNTFAGAEIVARSGKNSLEPVPHVQNTHGVTTGVHPHNSALPVLNHSAFSIFCWWFVRPFCL